MGSIGAKMLVLPQRGWMGSFGGALEVTVGELRHEHASGNGECPCLMMWTPHFAGPRVFTQSGASLAVLSGPAFVMGVDADLPVVDA